MTAVITKCCLTCGVVQDSSNSSPNPRNRSGFHSYCRACERTRQSAWRAKDGWSERERERHLLSTYGITIAQFDQMVEDQGGLCPLCLQPLDLTSDGRAPSVDHNHLTGKVRGILHFSCNVSLERLESFPGWAQRAINYLGRHN